MTGNPPPTVSIIVPTYNRSMTLSWTLRSILQQDHADFEVWVIGDGCTDDTAEVVLALKDPRIHWVDLPTNSGNQSVPNNEGLRRAAGRYIAHLGHDDLWLPEHLSTLIRRLEETGADFVHAMIAMFEPKGLMGVVGAPSRGRTYANARVHPSGWLYRREVYERCGEWSAAESVDQPIDIDYVRRIHEAGLRIEVSEEITVLKYPSTEWGAYARSGGWPQEAACELIERDPNQLRRTIVRDMARLCAREWRAVPGWRDVARLGYVTLREGLLSPKPRLLAPLRRWTFHSLRKRGLSRRGLKR